MVSLSANAPRRPLHPLHAILLAFPFPLFLGTLFSDIAYARTFQIQWANFAQWLNAGGLLMGVLVLALALTGMLRRDARGDRRRAVYALLVLATGILGLWNALVHAKDAWAVMPEGLWLSAASALAAVAASWTGYSGFRAGGWE